MHTRHQRWRKVRCETKPTSERLRRCDKGSTTKSIADIWLVELLAEVPDPIVTDAWAVGSDAWI